MELYGDIWGFRVSGHSKNGNQKDEKKEMKLVSYRGFYRVECGEAE